MIVTVNIFILLLAPGFICGVNVAIDGMIDLGPKWNYIYDIRTNGEFTPTDGTQITAMDILRLKNDMPDSKFNNSSNKVIQTHDYLRDLSANVVEIKSEMTSIPKRVTIYEENVKINDIFEIPRKVKEDTAINEFIKHIFKQTLTVFETLKKKIDDEDVKNRIDFLSRSYETKFHDFVTETQKQSIKTKLGKQKVILNTIDTSNRILKRLVNYLIGDISSGDALRTKMAATNVFRNEVEREIQMEYKHACVKFGICRHVNNFSGFLIDFINIILKNDDRKITLAVNALTDVLKDADFERVMDIETRLGFLKGIDYIEKSDTMIQKAVFVILKNILHNKNLPFVIESTKAGESVNKTVAFLNLIDILEKTLPGDDTNLLEWNDIRNCIREWSDGSRDDIMDIIQAFVDYLKRAVDKLDTKSARDVGFCLRTILVKNRQF